ncbi:MAG: hypothetical protein DRR08_16160 [Candidatus Parabeggiatoa sp. nov. 2]|nr:MAG: hypothetical protein B6247_14770 [Beggiatoa sp. 4572_84]RKZ58543.1 MAG: hypothetical protein DRR08_16160 [Gammaproteobacteria bacterium]HEC84078.1 VWA domain-containing protein [Thioploca sp.]
MLLRLLVLSVILIQIPYAVGNDGLDVVFLIDQSASMSGSQSHPTPNDKHGHRISIVKNVVHRLAEQVENTSQVHRISVVEFGSKIQVPISNLELSYDPSAPPGTTARNAVREIQSSLKSKEMNNTNTPKGIKATLAEFRKLSAANTSGGKRQRQLLFITDGRPRVRGPAFSGPLIHINRLWRDIKNQAPDLKDKGITLWIVGLNDASNYWNGGDGVFWENMAGYDKARLANTSFPNIATLVQDIVGKWLNVNTVALETDEYHSRPYLKQIVFSAHFNKPGAPLKIIDPNGLAIPVSAGTSQREMYARYVVDNPTLGTYLIKKTRGFIYKVFVEEKLPTLQFLRPLGTTNQNVETNIVFKVIQGGRTLDVLPQWPIDAKVTITAPSGKVQTLPATFEGNGKYAAAWKPLEVGEHQFDFQGYITVNTNKGAKQYKLVNDSVAHHAGRVEVIAYTPSPNAPSTNTQMPNTALWLRLETPKPQEGLTISPMAEKATIKMSLYEGNNRVTALKDLVTKPETWLRLEKMDKSGIPLLEVPLKVENGYFVAQLPIQLNIGNGEGWWYPGQLHLHLVAQPNQLPEDRKLNGIWLPKAVEDKRLNANPMTVAFIEINLSSWLLFLIGVVPVLVLGVPILFTLLILVPKLNIRKEDKGRTVNLLIYDGMDDPGAVAAKKVPITGKTSLKYDGQIRVMTEGKAMVAEYFRVKRESNPTSPQVIVEYRWQGEQKTHILMLSGRFCKNLEGLPSGNYLIALSY